jgi:hypothetical protein
MGHLHPFSIYNQRLHLQNHGHRAQINRSQASSSDILQPGVAHWATQVRRFASKNLLGHKVQPWMRFEPWVDLDHLEFQDPNIEVLYQYHVMII